MKKVGIIVNKLKDKNLNLTKRIVKHLEDRGSIILLVHEIAQEIEKVHLGIHEYDLYLEADFVIVLGGDGTILGTSRQIGFAQTPILGVNMGHLGFITEVETEDVFNALDKILIDNFKIENRLMLEATIIQKDTAIANFYCLNEIGITKGALARMVTLKTFINDNYFGTYNADGLLISTPTGSTAYSLSAGGPIVVPYLKVVMITPICPHTLNSRTLVISEKEEIKIEVLNNNKDVYLTADGQENYQIGLIDTIIIKRAKFDARFIKVSDRSFYDVLNKKIKERF